MNPNAVRGGVYGHLLGDAAGVPYEFKPAAALAPWSDRIDMTPPPDFPRTYADVPIGVWSDDGALMLCLLESLVETGGFDPDDQMRRAVQWLTEGRMAVDGRVFDVGGTTRVALGRGARLLKEGRSSLQAGESGERSQGNGSLMRVLPLALWHRGGPDELIDLAMDQSRLTHAHPTCLICCAIYCLWVRNLLESVDRPFDAAFGTVEAVQGGDPEHRSAFETLHSWAARRPGGTGYVVDTLYSAKWAVEAGRDFKDVVKRSILLGNDTDTTAAVAGGVAGLQFGFEALPADWLALLRGREWVDPLVDRLIG